MRTNAPLQPNRPIRLFIAFAPPPEVRKPLRSLVADLREHDLGVRWEKEQNTHTTLRFLGDTGPALLPEITASMNEACRKSAPVEIRYTGLGLFPGKREPRVLWVGIQETGSGLADLQRDLEERMQDLGFTAEVRRFHPHLTIARVKSLKHIRRLTEAVETVTFRSDPVTISEVLLIRSTLAPTGSVYTILERVGLGGNRPETPPA